MVGRLFRPLKAEDGISEADLAAAEDLLGVKLPAPLRAVCRISGAFEALHQDFHRLIRPGDQSIEDGILPIYDENQGICQWGLRVAETELPDPPVWVKPKAEGAEWAVEHATLSGFLTMIVCLQAVEGGLPHVAVEDATPEVMAKAAEEWPLVSDGGRPDSGMRIYSEGRQVIVLYPDAPDMQINAAARTVKEFRDIGKRLGIAFNEV